jgi:hypothetical protein
MEPIACNTMQLSKHGLAVWADIEVG